MLIFILSDIYDKHWREMEMCCRLGGDEILVAYIAL